MQWATLRGWASQRRLLAVSADARSQGVGGKPLDRKAALTDRRRWRAGDRRNPEIGAALTELRRKPHKRPYTCQPTWK
jgi:hypothetical protein